ncbi:hypothetical protein HLB42_16865 (plasmid) [Deinococcus sp. D7000]|nr:hypothetical protein HLB42_16865 [Deinococcus sp. D7000]
MHASQAAQFSGVDTRRSRLCRQQRALKAQPNFRASRVCTTDNPRAATIKRVNFIVRHSSGSARVRGVV